VTREEAFEELDQTVRRLAADLRGRDGALVTEWHLVYGTVDEDGDPNIDLEASPTALLSHTLGALRFAELLVEARLTGED
jgi:hypothetical protein